MGLNSEEIRDRTGYVNCFYSSAKLFQERFYRQYFLTFLFKERRGTRQMTGVKSGE